MESITQLKRQVADYLRNNGSLATAKVMTSFPSAQRDFPLKKPLVAVGLEGVELTPGGFGGYWGERGEQSLYGSSAAITLRIDLYCPVSHSGDGCHDLYETICDRLMLRQNPFGALKLGCGEIGYDKLAWANRLTVLCTLRAGLTVQDENVLIDSFRVERTIEKE